MTVDVLVGPGALAGLAALAGVPAGPVSPLPGAGGDLDAPDRQALQAAGLLDDGGAPRGDLIRALAALAQAPAAAAVRVVAGGGGLEWGVWFPDDGGAPVSVADTDAGWQIDDPAPVEDVLALVRELLGDAVAGALDLDVDLDADAAFVLGACVDEGRRSVLTGLAERTEAVPAPMAPTAIQEAVASAGAGPVWLTGILAGALGVTPPGAGAVDAAIGALAGAGLLAGSAQAWTLAGDALALAVRLPVIEHVVTLSAARAGADGADRRSVTIVQGGVHDLLALERVDDRVAFWGLGAVEALDIAATMLSGPWVEAPVAFCPACGAGARADDRFCAACGGALSA